MNLPEWMSGEVKGLRKYNIALYLIASANVMGISGVMDGTQVLYLLSAVGGGYGLFNVAKSWKLFKSNEAQT